jgi:hypothetical protein
VRGEFFFFKNPILLQSVPVHSANVVSVNKAFRRVLNSTPVHNRPKDLL